MKQRLLYIDNLKGILILLVVLGHCIQNALPDYENNLLFRFIYSFHMPLFIFVSGFVSYKDEYRPGSITKRFLQLVVPFLAWALCSDLLARRTLTVDWLIQPDKGLWFLWVLFWISTGVYGAKIVAGKMNVREEMLAIPVAAVLFVIPIVNKLAFGFHLIAWYLPFYLMGYLLRKHYATLSKPLRYISWPMLALFLLSVPFWMIKLPPTFLPADASVIYNFAYKFFVAVIACISLFHVASRTLNSTRNLLTYSTLGGGLTLGIYAIHQPVIKLVRFLIEQTGLTCGGGLLIAILFVATFALTLAIYAILSLNRYTAFLFLGTPLQK
jgi:fucose 4-O-acetylase-like acetyltransferase